MTLSSVLLWCVGDENDDDDLDVVVVYDDDDDDVLIVCSGFCVSGSKLKRQRESAGRET